jgi:hypothetical protein
LQRPITVREQWKITPAQVDGLRQASQIIPAGSEVIILSNDAVLEWGPYLLQREVINTKFGLEWQPARLARINLLNSSLNHAPSWDDVWKSLLELHDFQTVYVVSTHKKVLSAISTNGKISFTMLLESPNVQVGVLGQP